jgi:hypothetical protein
MKKLEHLKRYIARRATFRDVHLAKDGWVLLLTWHSPQMEDIMQWNHDLPTYYNVGPLVVFQDNVGFEKGKELHSVKEMNLETIIKIVEVKFSLAYDGVRWSRHQFLYFGQTDPFIICLSAERWMVMFFGYAIEMDVEYVKS